MYIKHNLKFSSAHIIIIFSRGRLFIFFFKLNNLKKYLIFLTKPRKKELIFVLVTLIAIQSREMIN